MQRAAAESQGWRWGEHRLGSQWPRSSKGLRHCDGAGDVTFGMVRGGEDVGVVDGVGVRPLVTRLAPRVSDRPGRHHENRSKGVRNSIGQVVLLKRGTIQTLRLHVPLGEGGVTPLLLHNLLVEKHVKNWGPPPS